MLQSTKLEGAGDLKSYLSFFDIRHRATGFGVFPAVFQVLFWLRKQRQVDLVLAQYFLNNHSFIPLESRIKFYAICCKYTICLLLLQGFIVKRLPSVSEETLDFETVLKP